MYERARQTTRNCMWAVVYLSSRAIIGFWTVTWWICIHRGGDMDAADDATLTLINMHTSDFLPRATVWTDISPLSPDTCPMCRLLRWTELNSSEQPRWNTLLRTNRTLVVLVSLQPGKFTVHLPSTVKTFLLKQSYPDIIQLVMALKWPIMCWCAVKKLLTPVSGPCSGCTN